MINFLVFIGAGVLSVLANLILTIILAVITNDNDYSLTMIFLASSFIFGGTLALLLI